MMRQNTRGISAQHSHDVISVLRQCIDTKGIGKFGIVSDEMLWAKLTEFMKFCK